MNTKFLAKSLLLSFVASVALYGAPSKVELEKMTKIIGYFPEWGIYSGHNNYTPSKIKLDKITHVNYAFATISNGKVAYFDKYAAIEVTHGEAWDSPYKGNLGQLEKLKAEHPHLSVLLSIGGWTQSGNFHDVASTQTKRDIFAASVVDFLRKHKLDGADIDWEYPTASREPDLQDNSNDQGTPNADSSERRTFTLLLKTLREHLDKAGTQDDTYYQLSAAVSAGFEKIESTEVTLYPQYLDFINIMTYDMHGAWDSMTNHQSALYANPNAPDNLNIDAVVAKFKSYGVSTKKLIIGTPFYSRGWKNVTPNGLCANIPALFASANGGADGIWDGGVSAGVNPYYKLVEMQESPEYTKYYDEYAQAPILYSASKGEFYTYEDKQSLQAKIEFVKEKNLGGMIIWELSADSDTHESLLDVIATGFYPDGISVTPKEESDSLQTETPNIDVPDSSSEQSETLEEEQTEIEQTEDEIPTQSISTWSADKIYLANAVVLYNEQEYKAKWWTQGEAPGANQWGPWSFVKKSTTTTQTVTEIEQNSTWSSSTIYVNGDVVLYKGVKYRAKWWNQNSIPGTQEWGPWGEVADNRVLTN